MFTALMSVTVKTGLVEFTQELRGIHPDLKIISTGGTGKVLKENGFPVTDVAEIVGGGEILKGRVKSLSREIHAGLLAQDTEEDRAELAKLGVPWIDLVYVNFYALSSAINQPGATEDSVIESTDIGGPAMARSGAKGRRIVICDAADIPQVLHWLRQGKPDEKSFLCQLAAKAEAIVANYCLASARYHGQGEYDGVIGERVQICKYGENAYQAPAGLYRDLNPSGDPLILPNAELIEGEPSYNNLCDFDRLLQTMSHIAATYALNENVGTAIAVGAKHGNPCGAAAGPNHVEVLQKMMAGDPLAIFGGLIMTNFAVDKVLAESLAGKMLNGIMAPAFTPDAIVMLHRKRDECRFIVNSALNNLGNDLDQTRRCRYVRGGFLTQPNYLFVPNFDGGEIVKHGHASVTQETDMALAWAIGSTSNSNTITLVKNEQLIGNGVGQQDRVGAAQLALTRAQRSGHDVTGAAAYSDSFFPFPDGPETLIDAGVKAIFTSSGSVKDRATIDLCTKHGVALYMIPDKVGRGFFGH